MSAVEQIPTITRRTAAGDLAPDPESAWVEASRTGDAGAFDRLVRLWERPVYGLARRMLQNPDDAAEATQDIFLSAFSAMPRFRAGARFSTWLFRIASNHCISRLRRRWRWSHQSLPSGECDPAPPVPAQLLITPSHEADLAAKEDRGRVLAALGRLSPEQRLAVELKFYQDLTFEEIAGVAGCPASTVKHRFYTALAILKEALAEPETAARAGGTP